MAQITLRGNPVQTIGNLPTTGGAAPDFNVGEIANEPNYQAALDALS